MNVRKLLCFIGWHRWEPLGVMCRHCADCHAIKLKPDRFYEWLKLQTPKQDADIKDKIMKKIRGMK